MELKQEINTINFLRAVEKCRGEIIAVNGQGDQLNLKSTLSAYVFCMVVGSPDFRFRILLSDPEDHAFLSDYLK